MILEIAQIDVKPGTEGKFESAAREGAALFKASKGCTGFELRRSHEQPQRYRVLIQWETLEDHTVGFRESQAFQEWRAILGPLFVAPPLVVHHHEPL